MSDKNVVCKATVKSMNEKKTYAGSTSGTFKNRWQGHNDDIKNNNDNRTELSKYIWKLKQKKINYDIELSIIHCVGEAKELQRIFSTCNLEKIGIATANKKRNLTKYYKLFSTFPQFKKMYFKTQNIICCLV